MASAEALALRQPSIRSNERLEVYDDVVTQFAELVDGSMRTSFELKFSGGELYGHDGRNMDEVTRKSLKEAEAMAAANPNLAWELRRRQHEREEYILAKKMANGGLPNTMIIPSDFPPELMEADADFGGYNVGRKQTMNRVLTLNENGNVQMYVQSLDGSNRQGLEAFYKEFGMQAQPGELLGQRIHANLSQAERKNLIDRLTGIYDREMSAQFGGEWHAGRRPADYRNTYEFVCQQRDLVETCVDLKLRGQLTDPLMYDFAATMQERFKNDQGGNVVRLAPHQTTTNQANLAQEVALAGQSARSQGKVFSACGDTLNGEGDDSLEAKLGEAGFGNKADTKAWHGGKKHKNKMCNSCKEIKAEVGACHICEDCVKHPKKNLRTIQPKLDVNRAKAPDNKNGEHAKVVSLEEKRRAKEKKLAKEAVKHSTDL